jgi:hypothetical protein
MCRGRSPAADPEQRPKRVERIETSVEPEREFVEVGLKVLRADAVMAAPQPAFQVGEDQMRDRQEVLGHARIAVGRNREMVLAAIGQRGIAAPGIGHDHRARFDRRLHEAA